MSCSVWILYKKVALVSQSHHLSRQMSHYMENLRRSRVEGCGTWSRSTRTSLILLFKPERFYRHLLAPHFASELVGASIQPWTCPLQVRLDLRLILLWHPDSKLKGLGLDYCYSKVVAGVVSYSRNLHLLSLALWAARMRIAWHVKKLVAS